MKRKHIHNTSYEFKLGKDTPFAVTEAYKIVRTNIIFSLAADDHKTFVVSSANEREGKSTTSANLAITLAQTSARVLLIDADLRKPAQHKVFQVDNSHGLSRFLVGLESLADALYTNVEPKLDLLTAGPTPPNPSELLGSKNMGILLEKLEEHYDYIVVDSPPVNVVTDALVVSAKTAGVVLAAKYCETTYDDIKKAIDAVKFANSNVLGVIFTSMDDSRKSGSYYKGYRGYSRYSRDYAYQYGSDANGYQNGSVDNLDFTNKPVAQPSSLTPEEILKRETAEAKERPQTVFQRHPEN